jgi:putative ABC transport system permease protein
MLRRLARLRHSLLAIGLLSIGLGAAASAHSIIRTLQPANLPYPSADRLVVAQAGSQSWSPAMLERVVATSTSLELLAGVQERAATIIATQVEVVRLESVSAAYFDLLGVQARLGRLIRNDDDRRGIPSPVALISDALWRRQFSAAPSAIGRRLSVDGQSLEIIGVLPKQFAGLIGRTDVWVPLASARWLSGDTGPERPTSRWFEVIARYREGLTRSAAERQFGAETRPVIAELPGRLVSPTSRFTLAPLAEARVPTVFPTAIRILGLTALALLVLVIVNVTSLQMVRAEHREREFAIRLAIGADLRRITRLAIGEAATIAIGSAAGALLLRPYFLSLLAALQPPSTSFGIVTSQAITAATLATGPWTIVTVAVAALCATVPVALVTVHRARRLQVERSLRGTQHSGSGLSRWRSGRALLLAVQATIACAVVCGGALLARSRSAVFDRERGYTLEGVATGRIALSDARYDDERAALFYAQLVDRLTATPGITSASVSNCVPGAGRCRQTNVSAVDGRVLEGGAAPTVGMHFISPAHFATIGATLAAGRDVADTDRRGGALVAIVSQPLAQRLWPGQNPIGQTLELFSANGSLRGARTVVGVVNTIVFNVDRDAGLDVFLPAAQVARTTATVFVKGPGGTSTLGRVLRQAVAAVDPMIPIDQPGTLETPLARSLSVERFLQSMLLAFGGLGVVLASFGTYAMVAQAAARSRREIGIRLALGASRLDMGALVARRGLAIAALGAAAGAAGGVWTSRLLSAFLHGLPPNDPLALMSGPMLTIIAVAAAVTLPAWRAARSNPALTIRQGNF